jgi:protein-disulfide isomerase
MCGFVFLFLLSTPLTSLSAQVRPEPVWQIGTPINVPTPINTISPSPNDETTRIAQIEASLKLQPNAILKAELQMLKYKNGKTSTSFDATDLQGNLLLGQNNISGLSAEIQNPLWNNQQDELGQGLELLTGGRAIDESLQLGSVGVTQNDPDMQLKTTIDNKIQQFKRTKGSYPDSLQELANSLVGYEKTVWYNGESKKIEDLMNKFEYTHTKEQQPLNEQNNNINSINSYADTLPVTSGRKTVDLKHNRIKGNINAPSTIIVFADFQCPFCKKLYDDVEKQLIQEYVDTGKAKFIYKNYAFLGPDSTTLAEGLWCSGEQNKYWEYYDYAYSHQGRENGGWGNKENVIKMATDMGLDQTSFTSCMDTGKYKDTVAQELQEGKDLGIQGTPAMLINNQLIVGAQPYTTFSQALQNIGIINTKVIDSYTLILKDDGRTFQPQDITSVDLRSHDWNTMLQGKQVQNVEIAQLAPADDLFITFQEWKDLEKLDSITRKMIDPIKKIYGLSTSLSAKKFIFDTFGLSENSFNSSTTGEFAFIAEDLDFALHTNMALIINTKETEISKLSLPSTIQHSTVGKYLVLATSQSLLDKIQSAFDKKNPSLFDAKDFQYTTSVLDPRRDGIVYFSENFVQKLTGPTYRINSQRRNTILNALIPLQYTIFAYRDITRSWPTSLKQIADEGYINLSAIKNPDDYSIDTSGIISHKTWGSLYNITPIDTVELKDITSAEKHLYENFKDGYQHFWRQFIDPIGIGITLGDQVMLHTIILPLIDESQYNFLKDIFGGDPIDFSFLTSPDRIPSMQILGKWDFNNVLYTLGKSFGNYKQDSDNAIRQSDLAEMTNVITQFVAVNGLLPACKNGGNMCTFSKNADGIADKDWDKLNVRTSPLDPEDKVPYGYGRINDNDFIVFAQMSEDATNNYDSYSSYKGFYIRGSMGVYDQKVKDFFDSLQIQKKERAKTTPASEEEKKKKIIDNMIEKTKEEFGITTPGNPFEFMGNEIMLGIGQKNAFELSNMQNIDIWLGLKLTSTEKAKEFMTSVWKKMSGEYSSSNYRGSSMFGAPLGPTMGLFQPSQKEPMSNTYQNVEYFILPTGFINVYYCFLNNRMYVTLSQLAMNQIIDESSKNNKQYVASTQRTIDYIGGKHNIIALANLENMDAWKSQYLENSAWQYTSYSSFGHDINYLNEALTLAKSLPDFKQDLSTVSTYYRHIPTTFGSATYTVKDDGIYVTTKGKEYKTSDITPPRSPYLYDYRMYNQKDQPQANSNTISFDSLAKEIVNVKDFSLWDAFTSLGIGVTFTADGLDIRLAAKNPDENNNDQRFGATSITNTSPISQDLLFKIGFGVAVIIILIIIIFFIRKIKRRSPPSTPDL